MGFRAFYGFVKLVHVHRIATVNAVRDIRDGGAAGMGTVVVSIPAQRDAVVVYRAVNKSVVVNDARIQHVNCEVGREQLRTVHRIGTGAADTTRRHVGDGAFVVF